MTKNLVFLLFILFIAVSARAQGLKLGFVEDADILKQMPVVSEVQKILDQETALWEDKFKTRRQELKVYLDSINATTAALEKARADLGKTGNKEPEAVAAAASVPVATDSITSADSARPPAETAAGKKAATGPQSVTPEDTLKLHAELNGLENRLSEAKTEVVAYYHKIYGSQGVLNRRSAELSQSVLEKIQRVIAETGKKLDLSMIFDSSVLLYVDQDINYTNQVKEALGILPQGTR